MARLSRLVSSPGDNFLKKFMTKTDLSYEPAGDLRSAGDPSPAIDDFKNYAGDIWFCFHHDFFKKLSPELKTSLEKDAPRVSLQSALKIKL